MSYQIEQGYPRPIAGHTYQPRGRSNRSWPWATMTVGDSVQLPLADWPMGQAAMHAVIYRTGKRFEWAKGATTLRVWCVADPTMGAMAAPSAGRRTWPWPTMPVGAVAKFPAADYHKGRMAALNYSRRHGSTYEWTRDDEYCTVKRIA